MSHTDIEKFCKIDEKSQNLLKIYSEKNNISARSIHRILKVSRTIADLK
jgi:magnesium chelatase family protein